MKTKLFASAMLAAATITFAPVTVQAEEAHVAPIKEFISQNVEAWLTDPVVVGAIKEQNAKTAGLDDAAIDKLDKEWRAQATASDKPFVNEVLAREISKFLMEKQFGHLYLLGQIKVLSSLLNTPNDTKTTVK